ncbi:hypothetical protein KJA13_00535 [Patescibacteria group bacterium]|nr:hypothetical protein [Patescibacteria group bacterium]
MIDIDNKPRIYAYAIFVAIIMGVLAGTGILKSQIPQIGQEFLKVLINGIDKFFDI